jgi:hypothetical protein
VQFNQENEIRMTDKSASWLNWFDGLVLLAFIGFAVLVQVGILQSGAYPYLRLSGDGANLASYSAAWNQPDEFQADEILGDLDNIRFYATIHIPITRFLANVTGSYPVAFVLPLGLHAFLQLLGFYVLGRVLFHNRFWALLLSLITLLYVGMNLGEFWGFYTEPLPRFTFQALLPFILAAALAWKNKPERWLWIMAAAGLLTYVHPVSAPVCGLAIWLGFWACRPADWSFKRLAIYMILLGGVFVVIGVPFVLNYVGSRAEKASADYDTVFRIMAGTLPPGLMNLSIAFRDFLLDMTRAVLPLLGIIGAVIVFRLSRQNRTNLYIILLWVAGIIIGAVVIPLIDHTTANWLGRVPLAIDLVRGLRYLIPISLLFCLWALWEIYQVVSRPGLKRVVLGVSVAMLIFWSGTHYQQIYLVRDGLNCLRQIKLVCGVPTDESQLMEAIKTKTEPGSPIMVASGDREWLAIRYYAERPLVYTWRDGGGLFYANELQLVRWLTIRDRLDIVNFENDLTERLDQLIALARDLKAEYLVTDFPADAHFSPIPGTEIIYSNPKGSLLALS